MDILEKNSKEKGKSDTGVQFQEYRAERYSPDTPKIIQWAVRYSGGLVKDEKQANYVLLGFAAVAIIVSLILIFSGGGQEVSPEEILRGPSL